MSAAEKLVEIQQAIGAVRDGVDFLQVRDAERHELSNSLDEIALNVGELAAKVEAITKSADNAHAALEQIRATMAHPNADMLLDDVYEALSAAGYAADSQTLGKEAADRNRELGI